MKGLLLKDSYMAFSYCKSFFLFVLFFVVVSAFTDSNQFFILYPALLCCMLPVTLISYDEKSRWSRYCDIFPYSRSQVVSGKYLLTLISLIIVVVLSFLAQSYRLTTAGIFSLETICVLLFPLLVAGLIGPSLLLPFIFRLGSDKGRIAYYVVVIVMVLVGFNSGRTDTPVYFPGFGTLEMLLAAGGSLVIYFVSWWISAVLYTRREL